MKMNINPDLGDLEEMLAHVQTQIEQEIDQEQDLRMPSLTNVQESPRMVKRSSSFNRSESALEYRRPAPRPPLHRMASEVDSGSQSLTDYRCHNGHDYQNGHYRNSNGSQTSLNQNGGFNGLERKSEMGSQSSFQSLRADRHSTSLQDQRRGSTASLNGRGKTATLPRGYGSSKERSWDEYWAQ